MTPAEREADTLPAPPWDLRGQCPCCGAVDPVAEHREAEGDEIRDEERAERHRAWAEGP